jgi:hypothetical protein
VLSSCIRELAVLPYSTDPLCVDEEARENLCDPTESEIDDVG